MMPSTSPPPPLQDRVRLSIESFRQRRQSLWERAAEVHDIFAGPALVVLENGGDAAEANREIRRVAQWFDLPHPLGKPHQGEVDFAAMKLARIWHLHAGRGTLEPETIAAVQRFFTTTDFASHYQSENHVLLFHTARFLMATVWPEDTFTAYGKTGRELAAAETAFIGQFLRYRARYGWGEFDSPTYMAPVWECLCALHDFSPVEELRQLAARMLDLLLTDVAVESLHGMFGGAHGRTYAPQVTDHTHEITYKLQYLYFGIGSPAAGPFHGFLVDVLTSTYRPRPEIVAIALGRDTPYENRKRKHLHNVADVLPRQPLEGSLRKYGYWTPDFVMGCVQRQDAYPEDSPHHPHHERPAEPDQRQTAGYAHHQQHEWDLSFAAGPTARIFTHHPGRDPGHELWTGDRLCNCGHFFQNKGALAALYAIAPTQPCQYIHAYLPKAAFDEVVEDEGLIFVRAGSGYAVLRLLNGYRWTTEGEWQDREIISDGSRLGVVCEAGRAQDYESFAAFRREMAANEVRFDAQRLTLEYRSRAAGTLFLDAQGTRRLNGTDADLDYAAYDSPYLQSEWGSGIVHVGGAGEGFVLDFTEGR